jgi:hypothetical protein
LTFACTRHRLPNFSARTSRFSPSAVVDFQTWVLRIVFFVERSDLLAKMRAH